MSKAKLGKPQSNELIQKRAESNRGQTRSKDTRKKISIKLKGNNNAIGCRRSQESIQKAREAWLKNGRKGNRGSLKHQKIVNHIAKGLANGFNKIEIEKPVKLPNHHWRIIDVLVNNKICYEIGHCKEEKIEQLTQSGFDVIHLPYSSFK